MLLIIEIDEMNTVTSGEPGSRCNRSLFADLEVVNNLFLTLYNSQNGTLVTLPYSSHNRCLTIYILIPNLPVYILKNSFHANFDESIALTTLT
jgi:hypothetical protein